MPGLESSKSEASAAGQSLLWLYVTSIAFCIIGNLAIRLGSAGLWLPLAARTGLAVVTVLPLAACAYLFRRLLARDLDEFLQRILLEGMAFALITTIPLVALYCNLKAAGAWTPQLDMPDMLMAPALLVAVGIVIAWRRYS